MKSHYYIYYSQAITRHAKYDGLAERLEKQMKELEEEQRKEKEKEKYVGYFIHTAISKYVLVFIFIERGF